MMNSTRTLGLTRSLGGAIAAIALVALLSSGVVLATLSQLRTAIDARSRSVQIIRALADFRTAMLDQETGLRGYLLTGRETSLQPYQEGRPNLDKAVEQLKRLLAGDPSQMQAFEKAEQGARLWQTDIGDVVIRALADPATRAKASEVERDGDGKRRFDAFRATLTMLEATQDEELLHQSAVVNSASANATIALLIGSAIVLAICVAVALAIQRGIVRPLVALADVMGRLEQRDLTVDVPSTTRRNEVGAMARAVQVFKTGLIELDRTSLLRATADTLPAMVGYVDSGRRVGFLNEEFARWFDLGVEDVSEVHGRPLNEVFGGNFPGAKRELAAAFAGEEARFEHRLQRRGTGRRSVEAYFRPHLAPNGLVLGVVTLLTDITERKAMEIRLAQQTRDLRRSNEELEQFAYVASHDLKAPLRGIENLVTWIEEDLEGALTGDVATNMGLLKSRVKRLESLLDDLLAYSRAGRGDVAADTVDTRALVDELAVLVSPPDGFTIEAAPDLPTMQAARAPLTQALQNLIGNAIKHHNDPAHGHVFVDAVDEDGVTHFTVYDDGPGIPPQFRDRVFGMFQTLKPRDEVEGSGMGLAIVKKIVERQGGKVWLGDGRESKGLGVHFTWPNGKKEPGDGADR